MEPGELQRSRIALGLTQETLARKLGISVSAVSKWESGARLIRALAARALEGVFADALIPQVVRLYHARNERRLSRKEQAWLQLNLHQALLFLPPAEILGRAKRETRYLDALFQMPVGERVAAAERAFERSLGRIQPEGPAQQAPRRLRPARPRARSRARRPSRRARGNRTSRGGEGEGDDDGPPSPEPCELGDQHSSAGSRGRPVPFELVNEISDQPAALGPLYHLVTDLLVDYAKRQLDPQ